MADELIQGGKIGHVAQGQTSYYRNSLNGQARFHMLSRDMTPKTIDWDMFLGHAFHVVGDEPLAPAAAVRPCPVRAVAVLLAVRQRLLDRPVRPPDHAHDRRHGRALSLPGSSARGASTWNTTSRDVPDVGTIVADYDEGCQLVVSSTMISGYPLEEVIRGRLATIKFRQGRLRGDRRCPQEWRRRRAPPRGRNSRRVYRLPPVQGGGGRHQGALARLPGEGPFARSSRHCARPSSALPR